MSAVQDLKTACMKVGMSAEDVDALIARMGGEFAAPRRRLYQKDLSGPCYVYCLVNPRRRNRPFYIGISNNPWSRYYNHLHDASSAAWPVLQDLWLYGGFEIDRILKIYKQCADRNAALDLEHRLITTTPGLLNRCRTRSQMWSYQ